jgi:ABC-2 type transport system permease protein
MRKYLAILRNSVLASLAYRFHFLFSAASNIFYIFIIYFLWKSVYAEGTGSLNGMTFNQAFIYLSLAATITILFNVWVEYDMSQAIISGNMVMNFLKPLDLQFQLLFDSLGFVLSNFIAISLPALFILVFVFDSGIVFGLNFLFFLVSLCLAYLVSFSIDFLTGLAAFYTESIWGISICKQIVVSLFSGGMIPIAFFPPFLKALINLLPFQAIYNTPLLILTDARLGIADYARMLLIQAAWIGVLFALSRVLFARARRVITVNGG